MFYAWAAIGVWAFADAFEILSYTGEDEGVACDTLVHSFRMHFSLLIGTDWHRVMWGAVRMSGRRSSLPHNLL